MQHNVADGTVYCAQEGLHDLSFFWNNWAGERHTSLKEASKPSCLLIFSETNYLAGGSCKILQVVGNCTCHRSKYILVHAKVSKTMVKVWSGVPSQPLLPFPDSPHTTEV